MVRFLHLFGAAKSQKITMVAACAWFYTGLSPQLSTLLSNAQRQVTPHAKALNHGAHSAGIRSFLGRW
jgi:hypothetical protein